jgi:hypothetical protein
LAEYLACNELLLGMGCGALNQSEISIQRVLNQHILPEWASGADLACWDAASAQTKVSHVDNGNTQASLNVFTNL